MITIPFWLLIALLITNVIVWFVVITIAYIIGGILDLTYHERHKKHRNNNCPYEVEDKDDEIR